MRVRLGVLSGFFLGDKKEDVDGKTEDQEGHQYCVEREGVSEETQTVLSDLML